MSASSVQLVDEALIGRLEAANAFMIIGVTDAEVAAVDTQLANLSLPPLPADFVHLLKQTNGLQSVVFSILGTENMPMAAGEYEENLIEATERINEYPPPFPCIAIGRLRDGTMIVYNGNTAQYGLLDDGSDATYSHFPSIAALMIRFLDRRGL